jgi:hypothetical protein
MRKHWSWTNRVPALIAGTVIVGCASLGIGTLSRAIPAPYAGMQAESVDAGAGMAPNGVSGPDDANPTSPVAPLALSTRRANRVWCPECGVVESIVEIAPYADIGEHGMVPVNIDDDTKSDAKDRVHVAPARRFAMTVRFRDGTTTVYHESTARNWHPGVRVIVIAGGPAARR